MKDQRLLTTPGHEPLLDDRGWGNGWAGPGIITVACACGWTGLTIHERWFTPGDNESAGLAEPYATIVASYGRDVMLGDGAAAYGDHDDAVRLYLDHIDYDPEADHARVLGKVREAANMLVTTLDAPATTLRRVADTGMSTTQALAELTATEARIALLDDRPVLVAATPHPEG